MLASFEHKAVGAKLQISLILSLSLSYCVYVFVKAAATTLNHEVAHEKDGHYKSIIHLYNKLDNINYMHSNFTFSTLSGTEIINMINNASTSRIP
jgi:hypothetical protein